MPSAERSVREMEHHSMNFGTLKYVHLRGSALKCVSSFLCIALIKDLFGLVFQDVFLFGARKIGNYVFL